MHDSRIANLREYWQAVLSDLNANENGSYIVAVVTTKGDIVPPESEKKALRGHLRQMAKECLKELDKIERYQKLKVPYKSPVFDVDHNSDNSLNSNGPQMDK